VDVSQEGSEALGIKAVDGLLGGWVVKQQRFQNLLVLDVEDLLLESEEELRLVVDGDLVLKELQ